MSDFTYTADDPLEPLGFEALNDVSSVSSPASIPPGADRAIMQARGGAVAWRDDVNADEVTSSDGIHMAAEDAPFLYTGSLDSLRFVEVDAGARVVVSYYRAVA